MTLQLNPDTTDDYESKTLAEMRALVFDGLGFINPLSFQTRTLGMIRSSIINRLGLALALATNTDTFTNIYNDVYNAMGYAGQASAPPGVAPLLGTWISQAQNTLFARIEYDKGGVTHPAAFTSGTSTLDASAIRQLAIAYGKAHDGSPDAASWGQQAERYLADLTQRTPPNIIGQVNAAIVAAHNTTYRRYELGNTGTDLTPSFATLIWGRSSDPASFATTASDGNQTLVDDNAVELLAVANLKKKIGQPDADEFYREYEQYMSDTFRRTPPNATSVVNNQLKMTQQMLYRKYDVFRMERWWTWDLIAGERFYGTFNANGAKSLAPTDVIAVSGDPVTDQRLFYDTVGAAVATLHDGRVVMAGGASTNPTFNLTNVTEIFDPATGKFSLGAHMITPRVNPAYCLLADGRLFVAGGGGPDPLTSTEIYDPDANIWTQGPNMTVARGQVFSCVLLSNSTVLIIGGNISGTTATAVCDIYNPSTNLITATGSLITKRWQNSANILNNGKVVVAGGVTDGVVGLTSAEVYDPVAGTFAAAGTLSIARANIVGTFLATGNVLMCSGASCDLYTPDGNSISATGAPLVSRINHYSVLLDDQTVLTFGGHSGGTYYTDSEIYDTATGTWSAGPATPMTPGNLGMTAKLQDGRVLYAGGYTSGAGISQKDAMIYDPDLSAFALTGSLTEGSTFYKITAITANGESLPSVEAFILAVPADTAVDLSWTPTPKQPFVKGYKIYRGKTIDGEGYIATVGKNVTTYTDDGTIPQGAAPPTINNTQGPGNIDPRHVTWVGLSFNDNVWNPLIKGIPPMAFGQNINGVPTNYEIRQSLEIWPAPTTTDWKVQIKGYFEPQVFEEDDDSTTLDWQAIYLQTLADVMPRFRTQKGQPWFSQIELAQAQQNATEYVKRLVAGTHMTARYVPGVILERNAVRPVLVGPYVGYP